MGFIHNLFFMFTVTGDRKRVPGSTTSDIADPLKHHHLSWLILTSLQRKMIRLDADLVTYITGIQGQVCCKGGGGS